MQKPLGSSEAVLFPKGASTSKHGEYQLKYHKAISDYKRPSSKIQVGSEIEAWCSRCKTMLTHMITVMTGETITKVDCETCKGRHNYRGEPPGTRKRPQGRQRAAISKTSSSTPSPSLWAQATQGKNLSQSIPYNPQTTFEKDQIIIHNRFGTGIVLEAPSKNKILVAFEDRSRLLLHGR